MRGSAVTVSDANLLNMNLKLCLALLFSIALVSISGCKSKHSLSNRRVPVINKEYLDGKKTEDKDPLIKKGEGSYYGFNSHHLPVNYFEEKPSKEIFHSSPKKIKKKSVKIYRKLPKPASQEERNEKIAKKSSSEKNIVKVRPKDSVKKKTESVKKAKKRRML